MKSPAFQFYPNDFLGGVVATYSLEETGLYTLLLAFDWNLNGLPLDVESLARISRVSVRKFRVLWKRVGANFVERNGRYHNPRLDLERQKQAENSGKKKAAAASRWNAHADAPALHTQCPPTPTTTPTPSSKELVVGVTAVNFAVWCNTAIAERWGEQPSPLTPAQAGEVAEQFASEPWELVRDAVALTCRSSKAKAPPRHPNYFAGAIAQHLERDGAKRDVAANPDALPRVIRQFPLASPLLSRRQTKQERSRDELAAWVAQGESNGQ